ncbi:MAG: NADPH-dependent glutamate synthase [Clostridia bacterium]|nr:NADPH-dependent glutamate synthase [Clostridia bacterium]
MPDMNKSRHPMPVQRPEERIRNFREVALGYDDATARAEAERCLNCRNSPCVKGCPVQVDIPGFIRHIASGDPEKAFETISRTNTLPAVCGRVCPQENQCEKYCVRGIKGEPVAIGRLERFAADMHDAQDSEKVLPVKKNGHRVAVIGSGPSGLACAGDLAKLGYEVTVFEALHLPGGVLVYGIPEFRLPKAIVRREISTLRALGVKIETNTVIGKTITVEELMQEYGYEAVFIGSGAGLPKFMGIPGETLKGVCSANEFLTRINLMRAMEADSDTPVQRGKHVAVVGGGNVAMDAARCARRMGAEVTVIYRRTREELPARAEEVEHALEEGIEFCFLTNPVAVLGNEEGWVRGVRCLKMRLGEPDESGRRRPVEIPSSEHDLPMDMVIMALGTSPNPLIRDTVKGLDTQRWGGIITEECTGRTSREGIYAGGDAVTGAATVILAMGAGKTAAAAIHEYISDK